MKRLAFFLSIFAALALSSEATYALELDSDVPSNGSRRGTWSYAFSDEGRREWRLEGAARWIAGFYTSGPEVTAGVRLDDKRSLGILLGRADLYLDDALGNVYSITTAVYKRRYFALGSGGAGGSRSWSGDAGGRNGRTGKARRGSRWSLYSEIALGCGWVYKVDGKTRLDVATGKQTEVIEESAGDVSLFLSWQPGLCVRLFDNFKLYFGPTLAPNCVGFHLGLGF